MHSKPNSSISGPDTSNALGFWSARMVVIFVFAAVLVGCSSSAPNSSPATSDCKFNQPATIPPGAIDGTGQPGIGDSYYPNLGNGGYDVINYNIDLSWDDNTDAITATTIISATATEPISSFNLDYDGPTITAVDVNGQPAEHKRSKGELTIIPSQPFANDEAFTVSVSYSGVPEPIPGPHDGRYGWKNFGGIVGTINDPFGASTWYPANDHPSDQATFAISVEVPEGYTAASNGKLQRSEPVGDDRVRWVWQLEEPVPTYLSAIYIGEFEMISDRSESGVQIRSFVPENVELPRKAKREIDKIPELITELENILGPYPFQTYGVTVTPEPLGTAFESQSNSLFGIDTVEFRDTMVHELAHHWFGNAVTLSDWRDIWLKEGVTTYVEYLYSESIQEDFDLNRALAESSKQASEDRLKAPGDPGAQDLYHDTVYTRGALAFHALHREVGDETFYQILRSWVEVGGSQSSAEFLALVEEISGQSFCEFMSDWIHSSTIPEFR